MFINPSRSNSLLYAHVKIYGQDEKLIEIFNPKTRIFLDRKATMRDVKYSENIIFDTSNYIKPMFCDFLADYLLKTQGHWVESVTLLHNYTIIEDFFYRIKNNEEVKELYRWSRK